MANIESKQIKELDALTSVNDDDLLLIQTADGETKNIKNKNFMIPILNKVPQDNILANGGFNIWSRGENIVADNAYIECADKWLITDGTASKTFINSKSAIKITKQSNAREINLQQKVKNIQGLKGNKYTLSWRSSVDVDMNVTVLIFSYKQNGSTETFYSGSESYSVGNVEDHKITFEIPNTIDNTCEELYVRVLRASNQSTPQNIILFDVKLELGSVATPFTPKPYYEELLACNDGIIGSNPNLLINGGFDVWQRGTSFPHKHGKYCADRWQMFMSNANDKVTWSKTSTGIKANCTTANTNGHVRIWQPLNEVDRAKLKGLTLTYTIKYKTNSSMACLMTELRYINLPVSTSDWNTVSYTEKYTNSSQWFTGVMFGADNYTMSLNEYIEVEYIKVELGSVATPFTPKPISQELADCQCYCQAQQLLGLPFRFGTNFIQASISTPVTMRAIPTLVGDIDDWQIYNNNAVAQTGFTSANITSKCNGSVNISFNKPNHGLKVTDGIYFTTSDVILDAEIY